MSKVGGLTGERRAFWGRLWLRAAERFGQGDGNTVIAVPARRAMERGERTWWPRLDEGDLAPGGRAVVALYAWLVFEGEAGFS
ncbi:hypothetical protein [Streptomyces sp. 3N207]|uniref:hypothetical protein n=1 Tax=Streptomyces sp. 3N207 TaxID=3457417 RepID=UPI003FD08529